MKFTVSKKLITLSASLTILTIVIALMGGFGLNAISKQIEKVASNGHKIQLVGDVSHSADETVRLVLLASQKALDVNLVKERVSELRGSSNKFFSELKDLVITHEGKQLIEKISIKMTNYDYAVKETLNVISSGNDTEIANIIKTKLGPAIEDYRMVTQEFEEYQEELMIQTKIDSEKHADFEINLIVSISIISIILAVIWSRWITNSILIPLGGDPEDARDAVFAISKEDLTAEFNVKQGDDTSLLGSLAKMRLNLHETIRCIRQGAKDVAHSAEELSVTTQQIAKSSETQSESTANMSAAVEEVTVSISHVTENADETNQIVRETGQLSINGIEIIKRTVNEINKIAKAVEDGVIAINAVGDSSVKISTIINVIREISEQTNLLALNAAIEAARAGDAGRGFSVVADEVRKLAERTEKATKEINIMITTTQSDVKNAVNAMESASSKVNAGVELANMTNDSMQSIYSSSEVAISNVSDISDAMKEQKSACVELANNVERIAQMAEENNSAILQSTTTAQNLSQLSNLVLKSVNEFKLNEN